MTPVEALARIMTSRSADWVDDARVFHDRLRALGFAVVPIEPTDAQVEAMARAWCQLRWRTHEESARAAYAAAVKEASGD